MKISEQAEEALETLWMETEEGDNKSLHRDFFEVDNPESIFSEMQDLDLIKISADQISLTDSGRDEARSIVRRHRLAERLLTDILDTDHELIEDRACHFEHLLHEGIDDNICILLGHPKVCPHGKPIPQGECCREYRADAGQVVIPLPDLDSGQRGEIAYVHTQNHSNLQKLMATGVLPGMDIQLIQKFPSYVFQVGETQIAVDREIAQEIYVRLHSNKEGRRKRRKQRHRQKNN